MRERKREKMNPVDRILAFLEAGPEIENYRVKDIESIPIEAVIARLAELGSDAHVPEKLMYLASSLGTPAMKVIEAICGEEISDEDVEGLQIMQVQSALHSAGQNYRAGIERVLQMIENGQPADDVTANVSSGSRFSANGPSLRPEPPTMGVSRLIEGNVDLVDHARVAGWAFDPTQPDLPVCLEVLVDGASVGVVTADTHREDLQKAGKGSGRCAFNFHLAQILAFDKDHCVALRRISDGATLPNVPVLLNADPIEPGPLEGHVDTCSTSAVEGWALDTWHIDVPVRLEILLGARVIGQVLANQFRPDLAEASKAAGFCSFAFQFDPTPQRLGFEQERVLVRRACDHKLLQTAESKHVAA